MKTLTRVLDTIDPPADEEGSWLIATDSATDHVGEDNE